MGGNGADISSGKLSLVDHTDLITGYNAVFAFKSCLGNIKYIGFSIAGNRQVCTVKIQQCAGELIHITLVLPWKAPDLPVLWNLKQ